MKYDIESDAAHYALLAMGASHLFAFADDWEERVDAVMAFVSSLDPLRFATARKHFELLYNDWLAVHEGAK